jgi:hypothetical protein
MEAHHKRIRGRERTWTEGGGGAIPLPVLCGSLCRVARARIVLFAPIKSTYQLHWVTAGDTIRELNRFYRQMKFNDMI